MTASKQNQRVLPSRRNVLSGKAKQTKGGLTKTGLTRNSQGKIVSKKKSDKAKSNLWIKATNLARKELGLGGFQAVGGKTEKGKRLYTKAREIWEGFSK
jgi:hypothetical protein